MKENKKKLMILIWDMGIGGVQKRVRDIVIDIGKNNPSWEVHLLIKRRTKNFHIEKIQKRSKTKIKYYVFTGNYKRSKSLYALFWIIRSYLEIKPDVTLTFLDHLSIIMVTLKRICCWQKTKLVLNEGILTSDYINIHRKKKKLWKLLVKLSYKHADRIIVPAKAVKRDLATNFNVPTKKIKVIHNWTLFTPKPEIKKIYDLIFIGRISKEKIPFSLVNIVKELKKDYPSISLIMLGRGDLEHQIKNKIKKFNLQKNIKLLGYKSNVYPFIRKSKILLHTSINEGLPNVVVEAYTGGVPSVSTDFKGSSEIIIQGKTGFVTNSERKIVQYIKGLLADDKKRKIMGKSAQKHVMKNYSMGNQKKFINTLLS